MKFPLLFSRLFTLWLLLTANLASAQFSIVENWYRAASIMLDNEIEPSEANASSDFHWNPLTLNDKPLDYAMFGIRSQGVLAVVKGNPELPNAEKIPFRIYLRRDGVMVNTPQCNSTQQVFSIKLSEVLQLAKPGDHLIIEPVRTSDRKAKRFIKLIEGGGC